MIIRLFQKKSKQMPLFPKKFWAKQSFTVGNSVKLCCTPWKFQDQKSKAKFQGQKSSLMGIQRDFFLIAPENSTSFSIDP